MHMALCILNIAGYGASSTTFATVDTEVQHNYWSDGFSTRKCSTYIYKETTESRNHFTSVR